MVDQRQQQQALGHAADAQIHPAPRADGRSAGAHRSLGGTPLWIPSYHAFPSRAAFLAACDALAWPRGPDNMPMPPDGAMLVEIGPLIAPPSIGPDGLPADPR